MEKPLRTFDSVAVFWARERAGRNAVVKEVVQQKMRCSAVVALQRAKRNSLSLGPCQQGARS